jgi:periplasmic protein TonB
MIPRERWSLLGSLIVHLAIVFFVMSRLVSPARENGRVEVDLQGIAFPSAAPGASGLDSPELSRVPASPSAAKLPARSNVPLQMTLPSTAPLAPARAVERDGSLAAPGVPALPGQRTVPMTWPGGGGGGGEGVAGGGRGGTRAGRGGSGRDGRGDGEGGSALQGYLAAVRMRIDAAKRYPRIAEQRRIEGRALVTFSLSAAGVLIGEPKLTRSSGYSQLDEAALMAVSRGAPYPEFPGRAEDLPAALEVEVTFILH